MRFGTFVDERRGDGVFVAFGRVLLALRWRWHFYAVRPPGKPGYFRLYVGPLEIETRPWSLP
ncbi:hypothetical protein LMG26685_02915 [Achromobacter mucicolens]|nr:hypothetical protein LMG26685_02915 [Achromobacter mucicolens]